MLHTLFFYKSNDMNWKSIFLKSIYLISIIILVILVVRILVFLPHDQAFIALFPVIIGLIVYLIRPIRDKICNVITNFFIEKNIYKILVFGRPGSGKTTFIETAFTIQNPDKNRRSTKKFNYYKFEVGLDLNNYRKVAIADYTGQNPSQIILESSLDFFGARGSRLLNAILFIVDIVPRKTEQDGTPLNDESLLNWLRDGNILDKIESRVQEQYEYINEASLELLFKSLYSPNLNRVIFVINKLDLIDKLIDDGYLDISNFSSSSDYAKHQFKRMKYEIDRACEALNITQSPCFTICAKKTDDLNPLIRSLLTNQ